MKTKLLLMTALMGVATLSARAGIRFGFSIGLPLPFVAVAPAAPVVVAPPVVVTAPVAVAPPVVVAAPVVVAPAYAGYVWAPGYWTVCGYSRVWVPGCWHYGPAHYYYGHPYGYGWRR
jgi:hypothetical protein